MLEDVSNALDWVFASVSSIGGDSQKVQLLGQSAGAHLLSLLLLRKPGRWNVERFFALSGPFDLVKLLPRLNARGLNSRMFAAILGGDVFGASPIRQLTAPLQLPPIRLYHGTRDATVPMASSVEFCKALRDRGADCQVTLLDGMTHSEPLLEGPLQGQHVFADLILRELGIHATLPEDKPGQWRITLIKLAQMIMPF
jgi:acetyl esterase/lipase